MSSPLYSPIVECTTVRLSSLVSGTQTKTAKSSSIFSFIIQTLLIASSFRFFFQQVFSYCFFNGSIVTRRKSGSYNNSKGKILKKKRWNQYQSKMATSSRSIVYTSSVYRKPGQFLSIQACLPTNLPPRWTNPSSRLLYQYMSSDLKSQQRKETLLTRRDEDLVVVLVFFPILSSFLAFCQRQ